MPFCSQCGTEISSDSAFCRECGADLESQEQDLSDHSLTTDEEKISDSDDTDIPSPNTTPDIENTDDEIESKDGINWSHAGIALFIAILPAFGAYVSVSLAVSSPVLWIFGVTIPIFGYLLYQRPSVKAMIGGMCFWLAVEAFLTPLTLLIYTFVFTSGQSMSAAGTAGAAIGGLILVVGAFVVGLPVGIVLYLISNRLDVD